ncbi:DOMON domain-containing protein frrs1L [Boothiomyces sp. JEL0866]|nr:DOMON domain-containing protein frrs1L [Boothiomyces sp. JEL0866]
MEYISIIVLLQLVNAVSVTPTTNFQVIAGYSGSNTCYTIFSGQSGWAAIGIGSSSMSGADVYAGWKNSTSGITLANLKSTGHSQPGVNSVQNAWVVPLMSTAPSWSQLSFSFCRPTVVTSGTTITSSVPYIYASGTSSPSTPDSVSSRFSQHQSVYGSFSIDATVTNFSPSQTGTSTSAGNSPAAGTSPTSAGGSNMNTDAASPTNPVGLLQTGQTGTAGQTGATNNGRSNQAILTAPDSFPYSNIVAVHGCLMFFAWSVCPTIGIFIARYFKKLGHLWFLLHVGLAITTTLCTIVGFLLIFLYYTPPHFSGSDFMNGSHTRWGLFILIGMVMQVVLGVASDRLFSPSRTKIPCGIGLFSTDFGIDESIVTLYWVFLLFTVALFIYGETKFGQVHHVHEEKKMNNAVSNDNLIK